MAHVGMHDGPEEDTTLRDPQSFEQPKSTKDVSQAIVYIPKAPKEPNMKHSASVFWTSPKRLTFDPNVIKTVETQTVKV